jgi:NADP-dependent 3-hydroxy acid dehydrogenase YdfG
MSVVLTARKPELGEPAVAKLKKQLPNSTVSYCQLDITDPASVDACKAKLEKDFGKVDILINNAGIAYKGNTFGADEAATTIDCNLKGTRRACEALLPLVEAAGGGRIVNVCSRHASTLTSHCTCAAPLSLPFLERPLVSRRSWELPTDCEVFEIKIGLRLIADRSPLTTCHDVF